MGTHKIYRGIQYRTNILGSLYGDCHELLADWSWLDGTLRVAAPSEVIEEDWTREFVRRTLRRVGKMPHLAINFRRRRQTSRIYEQRTSNGKGNVYEVI